MRPMWAKLSKFSNKLILRSNTNSHKLLLQKDSPTAADYLHAMQDILPHEWPRYRREG